MKDWKLIYDSGETTEEITSTPKINVSGYDELMIIAKAVPTDTNKTTRNGNLIIMSTERNKCNFILGNNLLSPNGNTRMSIALVRKVLEFIYVDTATSLNAKDVFNTVEPVDNLKTMHNTIAKFEEEINEIYLTNLNEDLNYRFGVGSRFAVYAR